MIIRPGEPTPGSPRKQTEPLRMPLTPPRRPAPTESWRARARSACAALLAAASLTAGIAVPVGLATPAAAQARFGAAVWVNDRAITHHEVEQRARFLQVIGAGGPDPRARARERLIDDTLQLQAARRFGLRATPEQINEGMEEFAARAELSAAEFIDALRQEGVSPDTFRDFVHAGLVWRELVQGRYGPDVLVSDAQVDRALSIANVRPVEEVLISEIFLPSDPQFAEIVQDLIPQVLAINTLEEFAEAARGVSAAPTAEVGGRVDNWLPLRGLPEEISVQLADARVGQVIGPIEVPGAFGFFQLRASRETRNIPPDQVEVEFRRAALPGGRSEANLAVVASLRARADSCAEFGPALFSLAPGLPDAAVETVTLRQPQIPAGLATELARLDAGEISANMVEGGQMVVVQLCARRFITDPARSREQVRFAAFSQQLERRAEVWLQTLREEAEIRIP